MRYGSVCSGIEAASAAWHPLGWESVFNAEIEKFPIAVLKHHYPDVPVHGDFTTIEENTYGPIRLLVGGTPCQSFSIAGLRGGMDDERGNLALEYLKLAQRTRPTWLVWENVPGVLSSSGGRDFGAFLGGLVELGYGFAYRVLDAQYFGVPQRRRRVFVVGYLGDWRPAAAVLFDKKSMLRNPAPSREKGEDVAPPIAGCSNGGGANGPGRTADDAESLIVQPFKVANTLTRRMHKGINTTVDEGQTPVIMSPGQASAEIDEDLSSTLNVNRDGSPILFAHGAVGTLTRASSAGGTITQQDISAGHVIAVHGTQDPDIAVAFAPICFKPSHYTRGKDGAPGEIMPPLSADADKGDQDPVIFQPRYARNGRGAPDTVAGPLTAQAGQTGKGDSAQCVAFAQNSRDELREMPYAGALAAEPGMKQQSYVRNHTQVRRLTPVECERLQGFPDNYTQIAWRGKDPADCPDGPRYKALGNSMAVPVMRWIGERIQMVEDLKNES